jgi:hypothetical protein
LALLLVLGGCGDWSDVPPAERGFFGSLAAWVTGDDVARQAKLDAEAVVAEAQVERVRSRAAAAEAEAARTSAALATAGERAEPRPGR